MWKAPHQVCHLSLSNFQFCTFTLSQCGRLHASFVIFHFQTLTFKLSLSHINLHTFTFTVWRDPPGLSSFTFKLSLSDFNFRTLTLTLSLSNFHTLEGPTPGLASSKKPCLFIPWFFTKECFENFYPQICYCKIQSFQPLKRVALILKTWSGYNFKPPSSPKLSSPSS